MRSKGQPKQGCEVWKWGRACQLVPGDWFSHRNRFNKLWAFLHDGLHRFCAGDGVQLSHIQVRVATTIRFRPIANHR